MTKPKAKTSPKPAPKPAPTFKDRVAPIKAAVQAKAAKPAPKPTPQPISPFFYLAKRGQRPEPISIPAGRYFFSIDWMPDVSPFVCLQIRTPQDDWTDVDLGTSTGQDADLGFHRNVDLPACHVRLVVPPAVMPWFEATLS